MIKKLHTYKSAKASPPKMLVMSSLGSSKPASGTACSLPNWSYLFRSSLSLRTEKSHNEIKIVSVCAHKVC